MMKAPLSQKNEVKEAGGLYPPKGRIGQGEGGPHPCPDPPVLVKRSLSGPTDPVIGEGSLLIIATGTMKTGTGGQAATMLHDETMAKGQAATTTTAVESMMIPDIHMMTGAVSPGITVIRGDMKKAVGIKNHRTVVQVLDRVILAFMDTIVKNIHTTMPL